MVLWEIINYLKQICQEINKELDLFIKFRKNELIEVPVIKWDRNLENNRKRWNEFCVQLSYDIIGVPVGSKVDSNLIINPNVSSDRLSFEWDGRKYSIEIDKQNKRANLLIDDMIHKNIAIYRKSNGIFLYRIKHSDKIDFLHSMLSRFYYTVEHLKFQFGISILMLFSKGDLVPVVDDNGDVKFVDNNSISLLEIAKVEEIKLLIKNIKNQIDEHYNEFIKLSK